MADGPTLTCPFCSYTSKDDYSLLYHVEVQHTEEGITSPFVVKDAVAEHLPQHAPAVNSAAETATTDNVASTSTIAITSSNPDFQYVDCPFKCGERLPVEELEFHVEFHTAEVMGVDMGGGSSTPSHVNMSSKALSDEIAGTSNGKPSIFSTEIADSLRNYGTVNEMAKQKKTSSLKGLLFGTSGKDKTGSKSATAPVQNGAIKRLGRAELGPYAHEKRMPTWLHRMLEEGAKVTVSNQLGPNGTIIRVKTIANETPDLVHVLARLSTMDKNVAVAHYCNPRVRQVAKMKNEGGFCGYRNVQMLISYIRDARAPGCEHFESGIPSILKLQDMIENAWDMGFSANARIETGGIKDTRKYIGTPEAQALFQSLNVACEARSFSTKDNTQAHVNLLRAVIDHFDTSSEDSSHHKVYITDKAPIYLQHRGHSVTVVGVEVTKNGHANLVVFDPMFNPSPSIKKLIGSTSSRTSDPAKLIAAHRRGEGYLGKYKDFEIVKLTGRAGVREEFVLDAA